MNYFVFKIIGKHSETKRKRTISVHAKDEQQAEQIAISEGLTPPLEILKLPHEQPTDRQLEYARGVGIFVPPDATVADVSCLLSRYEDRDSDPDPGLIEFADGRNLLFSHYIGEKRLYGLIFSSLDDLDKIAFFTFSIYRWLSDDRHANMDTHHHKAIFYRFAADACQDQAFLKSMLRYQGGDLLFFGSVTIEDEDSQALFYGSSTRTIAYTKAAAFIAETFGTNYTKSLKLRSDKHAAQDKFNTYGSKTSTGCLLPLLAMLLLLIVAMLI